MPTPLDLTRLENGDPAFRFDDLVRWWQENLHAEPVEFLDAMTAALTDDMRHTYTPTALARFFRERGLIGGD